MGSQIQSRNYHHGQYTKKTKYEKSFYWQDIFVIKKIHFKHIHVLHMLDIKNK